ncbi:MAG TPA: hypothetical protein VHV47_09410 [Opitutaceae bacterium]|jgi:hypothetical protein|nr:hypothetical protein [Opitutaceae bacterium]
MSAEPPETTWEKQDASPRGVLALGLSLAAFVVVSLLAGWALAARWGGKSGTSQLGALGAFTAGPGYRTSVQQDWTAVEAAARARLTGYGWVDRRAGIVRIPVERAMELMAASGSEQGGAR